MSQILYGRDTLTDVLPAPRPRQGKSRSPGKHKARGSGSGTRKDRPKAGNYQGVSRSVLKISWGYYRALLATKNPFPSTEKADVWARRAWKYASKEVGQPNLKATRSQITLVHSLCHYLHLTLI